MPGYFGYISTDIDCLKIVDIIGRLDPIGNCKSKIVKKPGIFLACLWPKEASLGGNFIFEDDRWVILFDGDLVGGPIPLEKGGVPWKKIVEILGERNYQELKDLRGIFSFFAFNKIDKALTLSTDRIGMSPLYYLKLPQGFFFSTSISSFFCLRNDFSVDVRYIYDWLFFNFPVGRETPLKDVYRLERASIMSISEGGKSFSVQKYAPDFKSAEKLLEGKEAFDLAVEVFKERIPKYFTNRVPMAASITCGWDGVTNLAFKPPNIKIQTYTYGIKGTDDIIGGARVAKALDLPHIPLYFDENMLSSLPEYCIKTVHLSGGSQGILRGTLLPVYQTLASNHKVSIVLSGIAASNILRGRSNTPSLISPGVKALFAQDKRLGDILKEWQGFFSPGHEADFSSHIESRIGELESQFGPLGNVESQLLYHVYIVFPRYFGGEYNLASNWLTLRMPFLDSDILNYVFSTKIAGLGFSEYSTKNKPPQDERLLQAFLIANEEPRLRHVRIGNVTPRGMLSSGFESTSTKILTKFSRSLKRAFIPSPPLENWDRWVDQALYDMFKRLLLARNTRICSIVRPERVERLLNRERANPVRTNIIGKLLTLEITWRLIEGGWKESSMEMI